MKTIPMAAVLLPLMMAGPALAQGTEAQRMACSGDAFRLCASSIPNVGRIAACLRGSRDQLSSACRSVIDAAGSGPPKAVAETRRPAPAPRVVASPRAAPSRVVAAERRGVQRGLSSRQSVARVVTRPALIPVAASARAPTTRVIVKYVYVNRPAARPAVTRQVSRSRGFGSHRGGSEMAQAMYWMKTIRGYAGSMGGMEGLSGSSMGGMSVGSLMSMIPY